MIIHANGISKKQKSKISINPKKISLITSTLAIWEAKGNIARGNFETQKLLERRNE